MRLINVTYHPTPELVTPARAQALRSRALVALAIAFYFTAVLTLKGSPLMPTWLLVYFFLSAPFCLLAGLVVLVHVVRNARSNGNGGDSANNAVVARVVELFDRMNRGGLGL